MAVQTRSTVFALTKEVTEGTPVFPTSGGDFSAFQEGFSVTPSFATLDSAELQKSIGRTKSTLGFEEPTASVNHYLRHSGVEGTEPDFDVLLENALGAKQVNSTERLTAAASTVSLLKLVSGGSDFTRGMGVLCKDPINGYSIRNVSSVATNDLSLAQNLPAAPGSGLGVGKAVHYKVNDLGTYPTLSLFTYRGDGGALELLSGGRVTEFSADATAGEFLNAAFSIAGINYKFDPIEITATTKYIDFNDGGVKVATVAEKTYKDPYELASAIQTAMDGASTDTITCSYDDSTRKFTITTNGVTLSILWNTGTNTANSIATKIGFTTASDSTAALTYTSPNALSFAAPFVPTYDSTDNLVAKNHELIFGSATDIVCAGAQSVSVSLANTKTDLTSICAESGKSGSIISGREVTAEVVAYLSEGQAEEFKRYRNNDTIAFTYNGGQKSGGNWVPGTCVNIHMPTARISDFSLGDSDGVVTLNMTLQAFVESGKGEFFVTML